MNDIVSALINLCLTLLRRNLTLRALVSVSSAVLLVAALCIYAGVHFAPYWWFARFHFDPNLVSQPLIVVVTISVLSLALAAASYLPEASLKFGGLEIELAPLRKERKEIRERIEKEDGPKIFDTIELGLNQIAEYYTINKSQAKKSFAFSVFAVVAGLLTLIVGVWLFYFGKSPNIQLVALSGIGGILLQFIGGASFYIYNKSLDQLNYFYDKLIRMQDTMLSIQLLRDVADKERQDSIRERVILEIITRHGLALGRGRPDGRPSKQGKDIEAPDDQKGTSGRRPNRKPVAD